MAPVRRRMTNMIGSIDFIGGILHYYRPFVNLIVLE